MLRNRKRDAISNRRGCQQQWDRPNCRRSQERCFLSEFLKTIPKGTRCSAMGLCLGPSQYKGDSADGNQGRPECMTSMSKHSMRGSTLLFPWSGGAAKSRCAASSRRGHALHLFSGSGQGNDSHQGTLKTCTAASAAKAFAAEMDVKDRRRSFSFPFQALLSWGPWDMCSGTNWIDELKTGPLLPQLQEVSHVAPYR